GRRHGRAGSADPAAIGPDHRRREDRCGIHRWPRYGREPPVPTACRCRSARSRAAPGPFLKTPPFVSLALSPLLGGPAPGGPPVRGGRDYGYTRPPPGEPPPRAP